MLPVVFGECRGWYHPASDAVVRCRGIVMCAPFGYETLCTYRGWRELAEQLAAAGTPVLRFDYPGTGDSAGDEAPNRIVAWLASIQEGTDWLRRESGAAEIALCGLRLGATLAAEAAAQRPGSVDALILLAPVASGRMYLRELTLAASAKSSTTQVSDWLDIAGFRLHSTDVTAIRDLDLSAALARGQTAQVLIVDVNKRPSLNAASVARLANLSIAIEQLPFTGYEAYFQHAHLSITPAELFARVVEWSVAGVARGRSRGLYAAEDCLECHEGATERTVRFGQFDSLVGLLCKPTTAVPRPDAPAVLILNTGANHRIGNSRLAVRLARHLAAYGTTSLRIDAAGIGDSDITAASDTDRISMLYDTAAADDVHAALDVLQKHEFSRCIVVGVCSGAHMAFQAALHDPRIVGLALANLPAFDRSQGGAPALDGGPPPGESAMLRRPRMAVRRLRALADRYIAERLGLELGLDRAGAWLRMLQMRGTSVLLAYSSGDRALRELRAHFGRRGRHLPRRAPISSKVLNGSDHSLNSQAMQQEFIGWIEEHLTLHHGPNTADYCSPLNKPSSLARRFANLFGRYGFGTELPELAPITKQNPRRPNFDHDILFGNVPK